MIEAAFKAFARALRAAVAIDPTRDRRALDEGDADAVTTIGIVDYGMGNRRSVEKALERVGARVALTADHDALRAADGLVVPGVGRLRRGDARACASSASTSSSSSARRRGRRCSACASGMQLLFDASTELGGDRGLGLLPGRVVRARAPAS